MRPAGFPGWAWAAAATFALAVTCAPLFVVDVPAVLDYPNHLARFVVLAHPHDPVLSRMYAPHWRLQPNMGMDLLGQALLRALPPYQGGRILLALSLAAPMAGAALYARAAFGRWTWWSLGAAVIAFNGVFILGFMNFLLSLGIALTGAAAWRWLRRRAPDVIAAPAGAAIGLAAFLCHLLGFAFFALLVCSQEAEALFQRREGRRPPWRTVGAAATRLAAALGPGAALYMLTRRPTQEGDHFLWHWRAKLSLALTPFAGYDRLVTVVTALAVVLVAVLVWRGSRRASGVALALGLLGGLFVVAPFAMAGGSFLDMRLPLMAVLLLFAGLEPRLSRRAGAALALAFAALALGRAARVAVVWEGRARDLAELRTGLAVIPPGATVLETSTDFPTAEAERDGRTLPNTARLDDHLAALVLIERRAFWPLLFADPSQQTVVVRPPYDRIAQPLGHPAPWPVLFDDPPGAAAVAVFPYLADWRARFDYVLLVGPPPQDPRPPRNLELVHRGEASSLYRVVR